MDILKNYYAILEVTHDSSSQDIKKSYRTLSKTHHPDRGGNESHFLILKEAYKIMCNPEEREIYDKKSEFGKNVDHVFQALSDFEFDNPSAMNTSYNENLNDFKDKMIHILVTLDDFEENIIYDKKIICNKCNGSGNKSLQDVGSIFSDDEIESNGLESNGKKLSDLFEDDLECELCDGVGKLHYDQICPMCKGEGVLNFGLSPCSHCDSGLVTIKKKFELNKEDFIKNNGKCSYKLQGNFSKTNSGIIGTLFVVIKSML